jgi:hypothetical protein
MTRFKPNRLSLMAPLLVAALLALPGLSAAQACYSISNFAVPNYVNLTLNGTRFMMRLNFIGPDSAGITIDDNTSYSLQLNRSQVVFNDSNDTYFTELVNVSWLPVEHSVIVDFCSDPNLLPVKSTSTTSATTSVTTSSSVVSTTPSTVRPSTTALQSTTTVPQAGLLQGFINWLSSLFR